MQTQLPLTTIAASRGPGRCWILDHALQHLRGNNHRLSLVLITRCSRFNPSMFSQGSKFKASWSTVPSGWKFESLFWLWKGVFCPGRICRTDNLLLHPGDLLKKKAAPLHWLGHDALWWTPLQLQRSQVDTLIYFHIINYIDCIRCIKRTVAICQNHSQFFNIFHAWSNDIKISCKLSQRLFGILRLCPVLEGPLSSMPLQEASPPPSHHAPPSHHHILPGCLRSQGPRDTQRMQNAKQGMGWNAPSMWACLVTDSPIVKLKTRCQDQRLQNVFPSWMKVVFFPLSLSLSLYVSPWPSISSTAEGFSIFARSLILGEKKQAADAFLEGRVWRLIHSTSCTIA